MTRLEEKASPLAPKARATAPLALLLGAALLAAPATGAAQECHGVRMPRQVRVGSETLVLNGMGVREATVFNVDVYVAGLYLASTQRDGNAILQNLGTTRLVLDFVRDVDQETMNEAIRNGFQRNAGGNLGALRARIRRLEGMIPDTLAQGTKLVFTYREGALEVVLDGRRVGSIEGEDFARVFFAIWIGDHPPNRGLKRGLLGGGC